MAFTACTFRYDGISSLEYGLTLCEIDGNKYSGGAINDGFAVTSDHVERRLQPIHYGVKKSDHMEFDLVIGSDRYIDRGEIAQIAEWLCGRKYFAPLVIEQDDMLGLQYKVIFTNMQIIPVGGKTIGFSVHAVCDSPYAYTERLDVAYNCDESLTFHFNNISNVPEMYSPDVLIHLEAGSDFKMTNETTGEVVSFEFDGLNTSDLDLRIDGKTKVVTVQSESDTPGINIYSCMRLDGERHLKFPRFIRGENKVSVVGTCFIQIVSEFPMSVGL